MIGAWVAVCLLFGEVAFAAGLPVVFEVDDPEDLTYKEAGTIALHDLHIQENVPIVLAVIPCGDGTTLSSPSCINGTFHKQYAEWIQAKPGFVEVQQHGYVHDEMLGR